MNYKIKRTAVGLPLGIVLAFCACGTAKESPIEPDLLSSVVDTIVVDFDRPELRASEVLSDYKLIYLDSEEQIVGSISKLAIVDSSLYIADFPNKRVYVFGMDGNLHFSIDHKGDGPGEYSGMQDVGINTYEGLIEVLDAQKQRLVRFDLENGLFVDIKKFDFWTRAFSPLPDGARLFHQGVMPNGGPGEQHVLDKSTILTDVDNKVTHTYFDLHETGMINVRFKTQRNIFPAGPDKVIYVPLYSNHIYYAGKSGLNLRFVLEFGRNGNLPDDFLHSWNGPHLQFLDYINESGYVHSITDFYESDTHVTFSFSKNWIPYSAIYDKQTGKCYAYKRLVRDDQRLTGSPIAVFGAYHVSVAPYEALKERQAFFERRFTEEQLSRFSEYQVLKEALGGNFGENPMLVFNKFHTIR